MFTTPQGLKVAYMSGQFNPIFYGQEDLPHPHHYVTKGSVDHLLAQQKRASASVVDVLLSSNWPAGICAHASTMPTNPVASRDLANVYQKKNGDRQRQRSVCG